MKIFKFEDPKWYFGYVATERVVENPDDLLKSLRNLSGDMPIQVVSPDLISGESHLLAAGLNALKAVKGGWAISDSLSIEFLLYLSGQRQIKTAIHRFGVKPGSRSLVIAAFGKKKRPLKEFLKKIFIRLKGRELKDPMDDWTEEKIARVKRAFNIADLEIESIRRGDEPIEEVLKKLVIERVALLAFQT